MLKKVLVLTFLAMPSVLMAEYAPYDDQAMGEEYVEDEGDFTDDAAEAEQPAEEIAYDAAPEEEMIEEEFVEEGVAYAPEEAYEAEAPEEYAEDAYAEEQDMLADEMPEEAE